MKVLRLILVLILFAALQVGSAVAQQNVPLGENAALRYWSAFAEMQDSVITDQQAKELNAILDGTAPYDDLKYQDLAAKNKSAVETMARGTPELRLGHRLRARAGRTRRTMSARR